MGSIRHPLYRLLRFEKWGLFGPEHHFGNRKSQRRVSAPDKKHSVRAVWNHEPMQEKPSLPEMEGAVKLRDRPFSLSLLLEVVILGFRVALWHYMHVVGYCRPALGIHGKSANKQEVFRLI